MEKSHQWSGITEPCALNLGLAVFPRDRCYLVQQSPRLAEETTERKVMAGTELVLRKNLYEKCLRIPVGVQR